MLAIMMFISDFIDSKTCSALILPTFIELSLSHTFSLILSHTRRYTYTHAISLSLSLSYTHTHSLNLEHTHTLGA